MLLARRHGVAELFQCLGVIGKALLPTDVEFTHGYRDLFIRRLFTCERLRWLDSFATYEIHVESSSVRLDQE